MQNSSHFLSDFVFHHSDNFISFTVRSLQLYLLVVTALHYSLIKPRGAQNDAFISHCVVRDVGTALISPWLFSTWLLGSAKHNLILNYSQ